MLYKKFFMFLFMALQLLVAGCGGDEDSPLEGDTPVVEVDRMMMSETLSVEVGKYKRLDLRIEPEGDYKVVWRSEDEDVAVVADGLVAGVSAGETDITASVQGKSVFCRVSVSDTSEEPEDELSLEMEKTLALEAGESHQLVLKVKPESDNDVTWLSSDTDVASVSDEGLVMAVGSGTAKVLAIVENNVAICTVTVDSESEGKTIVLDLDSYKDADAVKRAIVEADVQGVTHYILKGEYSKLGYDEEKSDSNPFQYTNAEVIDFSGVVNWPWIEFDDSYNGKKVPGVPARFFYESSSSNPYYPQLRKVIFSDEILGIGKEAFYGYYLSYPDYIGRPLAEVVAPQLIVVKSYAFDYCSSLASIDFPKVQRVEYSAFANCKSLKTVSLPQATYIDSGAFSGCSSLTSINLPQVRTIGGYTFFGCSSLTSISLPLVTAIEEGTFAECTSLVSVDLPKLTYIGGSDDYNYNNSGAFQSCTSLQSVDFPQVTYIEGSAFFDCSSLTSVDFPRVIDIGDYAFSGCTSLVSADFPQVTTISGFSDCSSLVSINFPKATIIGGSAFSGCSSLTSVDFPQVTTIEGSAFSGCSSLTSVDFPQVTTIGGSAFAGCSSLTSVDFPQLTDIGHLAFSGCSSLASVSLPQVTTIQYGIFSGCRSLVSVNLPELTSINGGGNYRDDSGAFYFCTSLEAVDFPKVEYIGDYCFSSCLSLKTVNLPMVERLRSYCFADCISLVSLKLTSSGGFNIYLAFDGLASESCTLYLNSDKKSGGTGSPQVESEKSWGGKVWKEIIFE